MGRKAALAMALAGFASVAVAQTVQDTPAIDPVLDLPTNLTIFGKGDPNVRKPTAIVNDWVITGTDIDQRVAFTIAYRKLSVKPEERAQLRPPILRQLIDETLQIQEAKANEITVDAKEVEETYNRFARGFEKSPEQFRTWLREIGSSERSVKRQIEAEMAWRRLLGRRVDVNVSEAEANEIIARLKAQQGSDEYHVFEIYQNATPDRAQEVYAGMQRMIEQMREGTPFDYLARTYSEASTKSVGGDLGWVRPGLLPDELAKAVQEMQPGQVAGPIQLPTGFSIIYLPEKRKVGMADPKLAKLSLRQLAVSFAPGTTPEQAKTRAAEFAQATRAIKGCGDVANVAAAQGAEVVDRDLLLGELPEALQGLIGQMQVGEASQPFGSLEDGVRVLVLCGRDDPPPPGLPTSEQLRERLADHRTNLRAERMLRDLRRDALIEYR